MAIWMVIELRKLNGKKCETKLKTELMNQLPDDFYRRLNLAGINELIRLVRLLDRTWSEHNSLHSELLKKRRLGGKGDTFTVLTGQFFAGFNQFRMFIFSEGINALKE